MKNSNTPPISGFQLPRGKTKNTLLLALPIFLFVAISLISGNEDSIKIEGKHFFTCITDTQCLFNQDKEAIECWRKELPASYRGADNGKETARSLMDKCPNPLGQDPAHCLIINSGQDLKSVHKDLYDCIRFYQRSELLEQGH